MKEKKEKTGPYQRAEKRCKHRVEYKSNNSGGHWWLSDDDWRALENAGWVVNWVGDDPFYALGGAGEHRSRWLGCLAKRAFKPKCKSIKEAVAEWEKITKKCATDAGCPCCGNPHNFTYYEGEQSKDSGPQVSYSASF